MQYQEVAGGICAPKGFAAAGVHCGIRANHAEKYDLALIKADVRCAAAGVYTTNKVCGAPIKVDRAHLKDGYAQAIIVNSGNANTCAANGVALAEECCELVGKALNIDAQEPVDAQVALNDNNSGFNVIAGENGQGANATSIAKQAISTVESLGSVQPQTVRVELDVTEPTITNAIADEAKTTLETLVNNAVAIKVADKDIATVNASMLGSAMRIDANQQSKLKDNEVRNGYVVFDADKLQQYYDEQIKPNLKLEREDKKVVVNNAGEVLSTETEGHDGIVIADGADTEVGARLAQVLATGTGSVNVDGKVDPKQEVKVAHRVAIDLSDRKLYAYENDTVVKTLNVVVAEGNDNVTGECVGMMCTPTGDFNVWQKLPSQDMSGTLNLADGTVETWDVKDVGFVNYFSSGCAIHRIAGGYVADAVMPSIANGSHGCVGIGWDEAEWFYNWCNMGTSVHIQV